MNGKSRSERLLSGRVRHLVQGGFLALNLWLGLQFYLWVLHFEGGGAGPAPARPPGIEGWLPIAGLMNVRYLVETGQVPALHPAAMVLILAFLAVSLLLKKAFCAWLCPLGTVSEILWRAGRRLFGAMPRPPAWIDMPLRGLKYLLLGFFLVIVLQMPASAIEAFMRSPYGLVTDVKMLNFFRFAGTGTLVTVLVLAALSMLVQNAWCRYLCPYGALMGLASLASPFKVRRDPEKCIGCGRCSKVCPAALPVESASSVRSAECTACLDCVLSCPAAGALRFRTPLGRRKGWALGPLMVAGLTLGIVFAAIGVAIAGGDWQSDIPDEVYRVLIPGAQALRHP